MTAADRVPRPAAGTGRSVRARWGLASIPAQSGRVVVVTGANSGLGYVTARELARRGAYVVMACRSPERGRAALERLRHEAPGAGAELRRLDVADLGSIREFADRWDHGRLDLLINNAGIALGPFTRTTDGFEAQFGTNHLGAFVLTALLLPYLRAAASPRVVTVSSEGQRFARFDFGSLNSERRYRPMAAYLQSKRANLYFATELQRRATAAGLGLRSMAVAPGLSRSNILTGGADATRGRLFPPLFPLVSRYLSKPTATGALTSLYAATVADLPGGSYIAPRGPLQQRGGPAPRVRERAIHDTATARRLWELSEQLTGVSYHLGVSTA